LLKQFSKDFIIKLVTQVALYNKDYDIRDTVMASLFIAIKLDDCN